MARAKRHYIPGYVWHIMLTTRIPRTLIYGINNQAFLIGQFLQENWTIRTEILVFLDLLYQFFNILLWSDPGPATQSLVVQHLHPEEPNDDWRNDDRTWRDGRCTSSRFSWRRTWGHRLDGTALHQRLIRFWHLALMVHPVFPKLLKPAQLSFFVSITMRFHEI